MWLTEEWGKKNEVPGMSQCLREGRKQKQWNRFTSRAVDLSSAGKSREKKPVIQKWLGKKIEAVSSNMTMMGKSMHWGVEKQE